MSQSFHDRLEALIEKSGKAPQAISREAGLDKETVRKLLANREQTPSTKTLTGLARVFDVSVSWLLDGREEPSASGADAPTIRTGPQDLPSAAFGVGAPDLPPRQSMPLDIGVMGTAAGSHLRGAFQFEGGVVDYVRRPPGLSGARDVYALFVEGTSMEPQYFPGDLIYVSPHRPARAGDVVVVQCRNGEHAQGEASLGVFRRQTEKAVIIGKHNPRADIELVRSTVTAIHRVFTTNELFGL